MFAPSFGDAHFWQRSMVQSYLGVLQVLHDPASDNVFGLIFHHSCLCLTNPLTTSGSSIPVSLLTLNSKPGKCFPYPHHPVHACVLEAPTFQQHLTAGLGNLPGSLASETPYSHGSLLPITSLLSQVCLCRPTSKCRNCLDL